MTEPAKIRIRRMRISCAKSVGFGCGCGFVAQSKLPAIIATEIELSYLKLNSYKQTSCDCFLKSKENTTTDLSTNQYTVIQTYFCCNIHNNCTVGPIRKFRIRHDRILTIRRISDFRKSVGFRRIRNPSHPYFLYSLQSIPTKCKMYFKTCVYCDFIAARNTDQDVHRVVTVMIVIHLGCHQSPTCTYHR